MNTLLAAAREFVRDEDGITAIEYGLIAAVMAGAIATAFAFLSEGLQEAFETIKDKLSGPPAAP